MENRESLLKSASVLVVEDNEFTRHLIATILRKIGVGTVYEAASAWNAFTILNISPVSLILCDLEMEPMGGLAFITLLRSGRLPEGMTPSAPLDTEIPVAVLTAHTTSEIVKRARDVGATAFLTKPINPNLLQHRLESLLHERASHPVHGNGLLRLVFHSDVAPGVTKEHIKSIMAASQAKNPTRGINSMLCFDTWKSWKARTGWWARCTARFKPTPATATSRPRSRTGLTNVFLRTGPCSTWAANHPWWISIAVIVAATASPPTA